MALLYLLSEIAQAEGVALCAATVDHGLRPDSADEAAGVAAVCASLGVSHDVLVWTGWDGAGNLQDQARRARYGLLTDWAARRGVSAIALGHTADDQAETLLMRLGRAAGVTGLAGMAARREQDGIEVLRPMLSITRARLRAYLTTSGKSWVEDPSNHDERFDRIRARRALDGLGPLGITPEALSRVAENLARARDALDQYAQVSARDVTMVKDGDVVIDRDGFARLPDEIRRRIVVAIVRWIAGGDYPPRQTALDQALAALQAGTAGTLGGCLLIPDGDRTWFCRELNAVKHEICHPGTVWDARWVLTGPDHRGVEIRALGDDGIRQLPDWRAVGKPRGALMASPSGWRGGELVCAPQAGFANGWLAAPHPQMPEFYASILSH